MTKSEDPLRSDADSSDSSATEEEVEIPEDNPKEACLCSECMGDMSDEGRPVCCSRVVPERVKEEMSREGKGTCQKYVYDYLM